MINGILAGLRAVGCHFGSAARQLLVSVFWLLFSPLLLALDWKYFDIPEQSLITALQAFQQQSDSELIFLSRNITEAMSAEAVGRYLPSQALDILLAGSDFVFVEDENGVFLIRRRVQTDAADIELLPVDKEDVDSVSVSQPFIEEILIRGLRKSLKSTVERKKNADTFIDVLSADQIGQTPDITIAESLAKLPGFSAGRDRGNGSQAYLRGMSARLLQVTLDGRELASAEPSRNVRAELFPSELIDGVQASKTQSARFVEGAFREL